MAKTPKSPKKPKKSDKASAAPALPMFYNKVEALSASAHGDLKVKENSNDVSFAREAKSLMLTAVEFSQAARHYPIVFGTSDVGAVPLAVTGYTGSENIFIGDDGKWREGVYLPAYVRRYPFILIENADDDSVILAIDPTSPMISKDEGKPLFEDGEGTEIAKGIMNLCVSYHREYQKTKILCKQIDDTGILIEQSAEATLPDGKKTQVTGFRVVDEKAFNALSDKEFNKLRKSGALSLIYCHLWSMGTWKNLFE
ncbi:MAG: SapC family protein [Hyphomicrobiales bacterium]